MKSARSRTLVLVAVVACASALVASCSSAGADPQAAGVTAASATTTPGQPSASAPPSVEVLPPSPAPADPDLPDIWPAELPSYVGGQLSTVTISDDGVAINATWSDDASRQDAFATMESALAAGGYLPTSEAGGEDMLITTDEMISNDYTGADFDVNVTVVTVGDQATVMLNASRR